MDKILIIEDDEAIAKIYKIALTHRNHQSEIAIDGIEGVNKAFELKPKLILLDIMMPRKNGVQVLQELRSNPDTQNVPVFVLSNLVDLEMVDKMKQLGALKYLVKSQYTPDQIVDIIEEFFNNPTQQENPQPTPQAAESNVAAPQPQQTNQPTQATIQQEPDQMAQNPVQPDTQQSPSE